MLHALIRFILPYGFFLLLCSLCVECGSSPLDEHIVGEPEIECGPERIGVRVFTDKPFHGTLYLQNRRHKDECHTANYSIDPARSSLFSARLSIPLNDLAMCGLELKRNQFLMLSVDAEILIQKKERICAAH
ncbi:hypothetical protein D918_05989 [Trichuris suis]|nr:hypothetical protein D918_05989 [Trichuris suis]